MPCFSKLRPDLCIPAGQDRWSQGPDAAWSLRAGTVVPSHGPWERLGGLASGAEPLTQLEQLRQKEDGRGQAG